MTQVGRTDAAALAQAILPDGKIVAAGYSANSYYKDFAITRHNANGTPDNTFGLNGQTVYAFGPDEDCANAVAIQGDGKIVAAGYYKNGSSKYFALLRLKTNGEPDSAFGWAGRTITQIGTFEDIINAVAIQTDGKIVVAGYSIRNFTSDDFVVARYKVNGDLDSTFGTNGYTITAFGSNYDMGNAIAILPDGKILVSGSYYHGSNWDFALARYNSDGSLDAGFGTSGKAYTDFGATQDEAYSMALQPDGKIILAGNSENDFALVRYEANGSLDVSFGSGGKVITFIAGSDNARAIVLQNDGKIVAGGYSDGDFSMARYLSDGTLDTTFGAGGKKISPLGTGDNSIRAMNFLPDGKIVACGSLSDGSVTDFAFARFYGSIPFSILAHPADQDKCTGETATFFVSATGNPPLSYQWKHDGAIIPGAGDSLLTLTNITMADSGYYYCVVSNADSSSASDTAHLTLRQGSSINLTTLSDLCYGSCSGSASSSPTGSGAYQFLWFDSSAGASHGSLCTGNYSVTMTDLGTGCTDIDSFTVFTLGEMSAVITKTDVACSGANNGTINFSSPAGGNNFYDYTIDGGLTWTPSSPLNYTFTGLPAGIYNVQMRDNYNASCVVILNSSLEISEQEPMSVSVVDSANILCHGNNDGWAQVEVSGGASPYSYQWSNNYFTSYINSVAAGTYTVTVTDDNNCTVTHSVTLTEPDALLVTMTGTNISCAGGYDGSIVVSGEGGTPPYTYDWVFGNTPEAYYLYTGTYYINVYDAYFCSTTGEVTLTEPEQFKATINITPSSCSGANDASAHVEVNGGVSPYSFLWSSGEATETINNLIPDYYSVTATDYNNCTVEDWNYAGEPDPIALYSGTGSNGCYGGSEGWIDLMPEGGTPPYYYIWSTGSTEEDISGLPSGTYDVTVTDQNGCTAGSSFYIGQADSIATISYIYDVSTVGGNDGSIYVEPSGGTPPYYYIWSNGYEGDYLYYLDGLYSGTYTATILDANNCTAVDTYTVSEPECFLAVNIDEWYNTSCYAWNDGSAVATASGGNEPYMFYWSNGQTEPIAYNLFAGTYIVTVTDDIGCTVTAAVTITEPAPVNISVTPSDVTCYGGSDGAADIAVSGGTPPYYFQWETGESTEDIFNLTAGGYYVEVWDEFSCSVGSYFVIAQPDSIYITGVTTPSSGSNGTIDMTVHNGQAPFTYLWSGGSTEQDPAGLAPGPYTVTVTDAQGCTKSDNFLVNDSATCHDFTVVINSQDLACYGDASGSITALAEGGESPYLYLWSNGATTPAITGLSGGTYHVDIYDANNCYFETYISIDEPDALTTTITGNNGCYGDLNPGSADLTVSGGAPPYTYTWYMNFSENGIIGTSEDLTGLQPGNYGIVVKDAHGCQSDSIYPQYGVNYIAIQEIAPVELWGEAFDVVEGNDGTIILYEVNGGTPPYYFQWSNGATTQDIDGLGAGFYFVTVTDDNGCTGEQGFVVNPAGCSLWAEVTSPVVICYGANNGVAYVTAYDGTAPYSYSWSTGNATDTITGMTAGTYYVTVGDANGCFDMVTGYISSYVPVIDSLMVFDISCYGNNNGAIVPFLHIGYTSITWSNGQNTEYISDLAEGWYYVTIANSTGCVETDSAFINEPELLTLDLSGENLTCYNDNSGSVISTIDGGVTPYYFNWNTGANTANITGLQPGNYSLTISDSHECSLTATIQLTEPDEIVVSSAIAPVTTGNDGSVDLTVSGGTLPYDYSWSSGETTQDLAGLSIGVYAITMTDFNGCAYENSFAVVDSGCHPEYTTSIENVTCYGGEDGSAGIIITNGTAPFEYIWSNGATSAMITGLFAGQYKATITDADNCILLQSVYVSQPDSMIVSMVINNINCYGGSDGAITLSATGNTAPYFYEWSNGLTGAYIDSLSSGFFTVTVTDTNGCLNSAAVTLTEPEEINIIGEVFPAFNYDDGSIELSNIGGTPPYNIIWSNGETTEDIYNLPVGIYTVEITDANSCTGLASFAINFIGCWGFSAVIYASSLVCNGDQNGTVSVEADNGNWPYSYEWSTGDNNNTSEVTGLPAGDYTVTVTDGNGCKLILTDEIAQPGPISISASTTGPACYGNSTGSIDLSVTGTTAPFTYLWSNGSHTEDLTNLTAGTYSVTVTDHLGCKPTRSVTITQPALLTSVVSGTAGICIGIENGSINLTATGGTTPYNYQWSDGRTTEDLNGLTNGIYNVTVTDHNNCTVTDDFTISLYQLPVTSGITGQTNVAISAMAGYFVTLATGSTYTWSVENGIIINGQNSNFVNIYWSTSPAVGALHVIETSAYGCLGDTVDLTVTVGNLCSGFSVSVSKTNALCYGESSGSITANVTGGHSPFSYMWSDGDVSASLNALQAGNYSLTVTDDIGCTATATTTILQPAAVSASFAGTSIVCEGANNGSIYLSVTGGVAPYSYLWSSGDVTEDISNLIVEVYSVTITDHNGCVVIDSTEINEGAAVVTSAITGQTNVSTGAIASYFVAQTSGSSYHWWVENGTVVTGQGASLVNIYWSTSPSIGALHVIETNANGCTGDTIDLIVTVGNICSGFSVSVSKTDALCYGDSSGSITANVTGGHSPFSYMWSDGDVSVSLSALEAGIYSVTVSDNYSCTVSASVTITGPAEIITNNSIQICEGDSAFIDNAWQTTSGTFYDTIPAANGCDSIIVINLTVHPVYSLTESISICDGETYLWHGSNFTATGTYYDSLFTIYGCDSIFELNLIVHNAPSTFSMIEPNVSCDDTVITIEMYASGGTPPYTWLWSTGCSGPICTVPIGMYSLTVTDANSCSASLNGIFNPPGSPSVVIGFQTNVSCFSGNDGSLTANAVAGTAPYTYLWSNGSASSLLNALPAGNYSLTVTDNIGCTATATATVSQPAVLSASFTGTSVICAGANNGSINLSVTGGVVPYSYLWSSGDITEDISNLIVGIYSVTITDHNGCVVIDSTEINESAPVVTSAITGQTNVSTGAIASYFVTQTSGSTYHWWAENGTIVTGQGASLVNIYWSTSPVIGTLHVVETNANGCTGDTVDLTVTVGNTCSGFSVSVSKTDALCYGDSSGSISANVTGGHSPFTYIWSNGSASSLLNALPAGNYSLTVTDTIGCTATATTTVSQPAVLLASFTGASIICEGANNGSINLSVTGGVAPYLYLWSSGNITEDISNLILGIYSVTITDYNGCVVIDSAEINESAAVVTSGITGQTNVSTGAITSYFVTQTSGSTYHWWAENGTVATGQGASLVNIYWSTTACFGHLHVIETNSNGCVGDTIDLNVTVGNSCSGLSVSVSKTDAFCYADSSGSISAYVTGGNSPYTYLWSNGGVSASISGLPAGNYSLTMTDDIGCLAMASVTVLQPAVLSASLTGTSVICAGANNGSINLAVTGGTPPYSCLWSTGDITEDISNLIVGVYSVTVTDHNGCSIIDSTEISESAPVVTSSITGQASVSTGATTDYFVTQTSGSTYNWWAENGTVVTGQGTSQVNIYWNTSPAIGALYVVETGASGCIGDTVSLTVLVGDICSLFSVSVNGTDVTCFDECNGFANAVTTGGTPPYSYSWSTNDTTAGISGLCQMVCWVTVTDFYGCQDNASVIINQPPQLTVTLDAYAETCYGYCNGHITANVNGGTAPYNYFWSTLDTTTIIDNLCDGSYYLTVTDNNGCQSYAYANLDGPWLLMIGIDTIIDVSCHGGNDGLIQIYVQGGVPYQQVFWANGCHSVINNNLIAGTYCVTIIDDGTCSIDTCFTVNEPEQLIAHLDSINTSSQYASDGAAMVTASGGTPPYSYLWSTGATGSLIYNIPIGWYSVTITDGNDCSIYDSVEVTYPLAVTVREASSLIKVFPNPANDLLYITNAEGSRVVLYNIIGEAILTKNNLPEKGELNLEGLPEGNYLLKIETAKGIWGRVITVER